MNIERLEQLATAIEQEADGIKLNMNYWYSEAEPDYPAYDWSNTPCGTIACIGGMADHLFSAKGPNETTTEETAKNLGLTDRQANMLFFGYSDAFLPVSPAGAAKVIRHLIATGEVDWTILNKESV